MSGESDDAVILSFLNRGQRMQQAVDEEIRSVNELLQPEEPEPQEEEEQPGIREQFLDDFYWNARNILDSALDADTDEEYRNWITELRAAISKFPT